MMRKQLEEANVTNFSEIDLALSVKFVGNAVKDQYTEYHIQVTDHIREAWTLKKRYREFRELHEHLKLKYPNRLPAIPGKKLFGNRDHNFIRQRQKGLQVYMDAVLKLDPECRTKALNKFLEIEERRVTKETTRVLADFPKKSHQQIIEQTQNLFIDLAQEPSSLDAVEVETRLGRYADVVLSVHHKLDEADNRMMGYVPRFMPCEQPEAPILHDRILSETIAKIAEIGDTRRQIATEEELIAPFPPLK